MGDGHVDAAKHNLMPVRTHTFVPALMGQLKEEATVRKTLKGSATPDVEGIARENDELERKLIAA